jgi:hypothetical protein
MVYLRPLFSFRWLRSIHCRNFEVAQRLKKAEESTAVHELDGSVSTQALNPADMTDFVERPGTLIPLKVAEPTTKKLKLAKELWNLLGFVRSLSRSETECGTSV